MIQGADVDSSARYPPPRCYPGTRTSLIAKSQSWLLDDQRTWDILWLHGPAGVGKSAVAQTIAEFAKDNRRLGAAFFFSKTTRHNNPQNVFITLAYQLSVRFPGFLPLVAKQLAADPDLLKKAPHVQFRHLIVEPLSSLSTQPKHLIILDGLDECKGERAQLDIVELINNLILSQTALPIIWMICSRPEPHLMRVLSRPDFIVQCWREELPIDTEESRDDTARFIRARFKEVHEIYRDCVEDGSGCWPPEVDIAFIIKEASGLFVFASAILKYIEDPEVGNPGGCLADILATIRHVHVTGGRSPMETLDALYTRILSDVPDNIWPVTQQLLKVITVPLLYYHPNTPWFFSNFLGITRSDFYIALRRLHSVLDIPPPDEADGRPLRFLHASFHDYLVQPARSGHFCVTLPPGFRVNHETQKSSLRIIGSLTSFLVESLDPDTADFKPSTPALVEPKAREMLNKCLTWPVVDPEQSQITIAGTPARRIVIAASDFIFSSYSEFQTHEDCRQELKRMLRASDFNSFAFLCYCWDMVHEKNVSLRYGQDA